MDIGPLLFEPVFKPKIWGGRHLEHRLGKHLPPGEPIGESWEIVDLEEDQSVVAAGPARGQTLGSLVAKWGKDLIGTAELFDGRFPLLIKFLDARDTLSVQVHPDEAMAKRLGGRVRVKNEAWYIVDAEEGGFIYRGLIPGVGEKELRAALEDDRVESVLRRLEVRKGECYYLPSGTVHALGAGVLVAEVQNTSDITYRVYDYNRVDEHTGKTRDLHIEEAMQCVAFDAGPITEDQRRHVAGMWVSATRLVRCDSFVIERVRIALGAEQEVAQGEFHIWIVLEGRGAIAYQGADKPLEMGVGDTVLLPAALAGTRVTALEDVTWLEVAVPVGPAGAGVECLSCRDGIEPCRERGG